MGFCVNPFLAKEQETPWQDQKRLFIILLFASAYASLLWFASAAHELEHYRCTPGRPPSLKYRRCIATVKCSQSILSLWCMFVKALASFVDGYVPTHTHKLLYASSCTLGHKDNGDASRILDTF